MATANKTLAIRRTPRGPVEDIGDAVNSLFDPYRPERHYMRGPEPKWHAKYNATVADASAPIVHAWG